MLVLKVLVLLCLTQSTVSDQVDLFQSLASFQHAFNDFVLQPNPDPRVRSKTVQSLDTFVSNFKKYLTQTSVTPKTTLPKRKLTASQDVRTGIFLEGTGGVHWDLGGIFENDGVFTVDYNQCSINGDLNVVGTVNADEITTTAGADLNTLNTDAVKTSGSQTIGGEKTFSDATTFSADVAVIGTFTAGEVATAAGADLNTLNTDAVKTSGSQTIGGEKTFSDATNFSADVAVIGLFAPGSYGGLPSSSSLRDGTLAWSTWDSSLVVVVNGVWKLLMASDLTIDPIPAFVLTSAAGNDGFTITSASSCWGSVDASNCGDTTAPWNMFDGNSDDHAWVGYSPNFDADTGAYVGSSQLTDTNAEYFVLAMPAEYGFNQYTIERRSSYSLPNAWRILVSSDNFATYTVVHEVTAETYDTTDTSTSSYTFDINATTGSYIAMEIFSVPVSEVYVEGIGELIFSMV